jgi:hypothetical protein
MNLILTRDFDALKDESEISENLFSKVDSFCVNFINENIRAVIDISHIPWNHDARVKLALPGTEFLVDSVLNCHNICFISQVFNGGSANFVNVCNCLINLLYFILLYWNEIILSIKSVITSVEILSTSISSCLVMDSLDFIRHNFFA